MNKEQERWLATAMELSERAGEVMRRWQLGDKSVSFKHDMSLVTEADLEVNRIVIETVTKRFSHAVLGEEESCGGSDGPLWVCDPVDGTIPFTLGAGVSTFSIAVVVDGQPQVAVCSDPWLNRTWSAVIGGGTYCNKQSVHVSKIGMLNEAYIGASGTANMFESKLWGEAVGALMLNSRKVMMLGSTVAEAARVADGGLGGAVFVNDSVVDVAATALLVREAGGKVTDLWGNEQSYDRATRGCLFSNGLLHQQLLETLCWNTECQ